MFANRVSAAGRPALAIGALVALALQAGCSQPTQPIARDLGDGLRLAQGICPIIHCNTKQTGALAVHGPERPGGALNEAEIDHLWSSPIAGGVLDYSYPDGTRVFWVSQVDRIMKLRLDESGRLRKITERPIPPKNFPPRSPDDMRRVVAQLDRTPLGTPAYETLARRWHGYQIEGLRAYYALVSDVGALYVGNRDSVVAYGDAIAGDPDSEIVKLGQYGFDKRSLQLGPTMPIAIMIGMNVTPDGHLIVVTIDGTLIAITPDLAHGVYYHLPGEQIWNSVAVDEAGAIYVVGNKRLHKIVWTGSGFSDDPTDGAWVEAYDNGPLNESLRARRGSGTTPALMGSTGDADRFVVIADGADVNNLILYWRDEIPEDWRQLPGTRSRRVAGILPVDFGDPRTTDSYSENAATIFDYRAVLANNQVRTGEPMMLDVQLQMKDPRRTPHGIQQFRWNRAKRRLEVGWVRPDVSSPNSTPVVATANRQLNIVGLQDGRWTVETLDWDTGRTRNSYVLGASERYNPIMLALQLLPNGDPIYPAFGGVIHLRLGS